MKPKQKSEESTKSHTYIHTKTLTCVDDAAKAQHEH